MEYNQEFVAGKYGAHAGPAGRIIDIVEEYGEKVGSKKYSLNVEIVKTFCPLGFAMGKKADAYSVVEIMALMGVQGSRLKVIATLKSNSRDKKSFLENCVKEIGEVLVNPEKYTIRPH